MLACSFSLGKALDAQAADAVSSSNNYDRSVYVTAFHHLLTGTYLDRVSAEEMTSTDKDDMLRVLYDETIAAILRMVDKLNLAAASAQVCVGKDEVGWVEGWESVG